ncbi:unnamed protein product [Somion occarium]|uniref:Uncharacterized protein n=1 Tax=Somion occarium TaxID=3059160 RepID=A0ABP1CUZ2_9APHY
MVLCLWTRLKRFLSFSSKRTSSPGPSCTTDSAALERPKSYLDQGGVHANLEPAPICTSRVLRNVTLRSESPIHPVSKVLIYPASLIHTRPISQQSLHPCNHVLPVASRSTPPESSRSRFPEPRHFRQIHAVLVTAGYGLNITMEGIPNGWTACQHPEGALYFFHEANVVLVI